MRDSYGVEERWREREVECGEAGREGCCHCCCCFVFGPGIFPFRRVQTAEFFPASTPKAATAEGAGGVAAAPATVGGGV